MDILRVLSAPDLEVRKKTLALALDLVTSRTIEEVCSSSLYFGLLSLVNSQHSLMVRWSSDRSFMR